MENTHTIYRFTEGFIIFTLIDHDSWPYLVSIRFFTLFFIFLQERVVCPVFVVAVFPWSFAPSLSSLPTILRTDSADYREEPSQPAVAITLPLPDIITRFREGREGGGMKMKRNRKRWRRRTRTTIMKIRGRRGRRRWWKKKSKENIWGGKSRTKRKKEKRGGERKNSEKNENSNNNNNNNVVPVTWLESITISWWDWEDFVLVVVLVVVAGGTHSWGGRGLAGTLGMADSSRRRRIHARRRRSGRRKRRSATPHRYQ